jgi:hypothetical protein
LSKRGRSWFDGLTTNGEDYGTVIMSKKHSGPLKNAPLPWLLKKVQKSLDFAQDREPVER